MSAVETDNGPKQDTAEPCMAPYGTADADLEDDKCE